MQYRGKSGVHKNLVVALRMPLNVIMQIKLEGILGSENRETHDLLEIF